MLKNKKIMPIVIISILLAGVALGAYVYIKADGKPSTAEEAVEKNPGKNDAPKPTTPSSKSTNVSMPAPSAPTLIKSSGNNGVVPVGVKIEFICQSQPGYTCNILLVSGSQKKELGSKPVQPNQTNVSSAYWYWVSEIGKWAVTAEVKDSTGRTASSTPQTLEVK